MTNNSIAANPGLVVAPPGVRVNESTLKAAGVVGITTVLAFLFFAAGNFGLLNIFGARRAGQALLLSLLIVCLPAVSRRFGRAKPARVDDCPGRR